MLRAIGVVLAVALAAVAVWLIVTNSSRKMFEIGVVAGLWSALIGAFAMFGARRPHEAAGEQLPVPARVAEIELSARRDFEERLQQLLRREIDSAIGRETSALRNEISQLRHDLLEKVGGQLRLERIEVTRVIGADLEALQEEVRQLRRAGTRVVEPARLRPMLRSADPGEVVEAEHRPDGYTPRFAESPRWPEPPKADAGTPEPPRWPPPPAQAEVTAPAAPRWPEAPRVDVGTPVLDRAAAEQTALEQAAEAVRRAEAERAEQERRDAERRAAERLAAERAEAERREAERREAERAEAARRAEERAEADRLAAERAASEWAEQQRLAAERAEAERVAAAERAAAERARQERDEAERAKLEAARAERDRARLAQPPAAPAAPAGGLLGGEDPFASLPRLTPFVDDDPLPETPAAEADPDAGGRHSAAGGRRRRDDEGDDNLLARLLARETPQ